ncbi:MAG: DUF3857 domain-containing protein [Balneolaceae bacterium]|nr:DUF3857 domain-containing protein [Balneolaceae bacterium]MBO6547721.1 DUF3857 domain-containing protein [Balneolaceae bacterium]MBO6648232.1 DUF3857 domain-containing protein [Balneolaceae bacterium]
MKTISMLFILFSLSLDVFSQAYPFGDVPIEHLEMEVYEKDSSASSVILFSKGESVVEFRDYRFYLSTKIHKRVKVFSDNGFQKGDIQINYRNKNSYSPQTISDLKVANYTLLEDGKSKIDSLNENDFLTEEIGNGISTKKFNIPNLERGAVFEYQYKISSNNPLELPSWAFQEDIPVLWSEYIADIPEWFGFVNIQRGFNELSVAIDSIYYGETYREDRYGRKISMDYEGIYYRYVMEDIPSFEEQPYMKSNSDYLDQIQFYLTWIRNPITSKTFYLNNWSEMIEALLEGDNFGRRLEGGRQIGRLTRDVVSGSDDQFEIMITLYNEVKQRMSWDGSYGLYTYRKLDDIFEEGTGTGSEINMILLKMLKEAGIAAYPLILSTRDHGEIVDVLPTPEQFNHTIVYVQNDSTHFLLDASQETLPFNMLPVEVINGMGLLVKNSGVEWIELVNDVPNTSSSIIDITIGEQKTKGNIKSKDRGFYALLSRNLFNAEDPRQAFKDFFSSDFRSISIDSAYITKDELDKTFDYELHFNTENIGSDELIYFNPILVFLLEENPFKVDSRPYPIDFEFIFSENSVITVNIPEGWDIDELPKSVLFRLPDNSAEFMRIIQVTDNKISINFRHRMSKLRYMPSEYQNIKQLYDQLVLALSQNIVLKKAY